MKQNYRELLKNRNYSKMLAANFINRLGDSIDMMAFTWLTYQLTNSASWAAIMFGVNMLPNIMFLPFAGAWIEKHKKKWVLVTCDWIRAILTCLILFLYVQNALSIPLLLLVTFCNNTVECFRVPGSKGLLPHLLRKDQYEYGISLDTSLSRVTELIGIACSGIIIGILGMSGAIMIDIISFVLCSLIISTLHIQEVIVKQEGTKTKAYFQTLKEGFAYLFQKPIILALSFSAVLINALLVPLNAYQAAYISGVLHQGAELLSMTSFALSLGIGIGSILYPMMLKKISNRNLFLYFCYSIGFFYCSMISFMWITNALLLHLLYTAFSLLFGLCIGISMMAINVCLMKQIDDAYLSRVTAISGALSTSANPIVSFVLGGCSMFFSVPTIFFIFGIFTFLIITGMMFSKTLKQM